MKLFIFTFKRVAARYLFTVFVLAYMVTTIDCLPLFDTTAISSVSSSNSPFVEDLLRLYNISNQDVEVSRQKQIALRHSSNITHQHFPLTSRQQQHSTQHVHSEVTLPASTLDAQIIIHQRNRSNVTVSMSNRSALQRKQEVFRNVLGFVNLNGRPQFPWGETSSGAPPIPSIFSPLPRPEATFDLYERTRYIQPSCDGPKHADEEIWSTGSTLPISLHLFFNLSSIQSQTRNGFQLYVTGAKLRLLKFAEGEALSSANVGSELSEENSRSISLETPIQTLKAMPFFDPPLEPSNEEKIRVSVHNYTRALKRNRTQKKKLLDSQMALAKEENYMKLDIKPAARWWLAPGGRNFGLAIEVEDSDSQRKPVSLFFRTRNCSSEIGGSTPSDELKDPTSVDSPVLELTVIEMPEGRSVFEVPTNIIRSRLDETDSIGNEDLDTFSEVMEESTPRKHRHQHSSRTIHTSNEEQADEAVLRIKNHTVKIDLSSSTTASPLGKLRTPYRTRDQAINQRPTSVPIPTLATLEDHDLIRETEEDETTRAESDESRNLLGPASIFMRSMMHHQQQPNHSKLGHFSHAD